LASILLLSFPALLAQHNAAIPFSDVTFGPDEDVSRLSYAIESGNLENGPSSLLLKAEPDCVVPWHYHTAQEQLMAVRGKVLTEIKACRRRCSSPEGSVSWRAG
jgi:hypothetical protein